MYSTCMVTKCKTQRSRNKEVQTLYPRLSLLQTPQCSDFDSMDVFLNLCFVVQ